MRKADGRRFAGLGTLGSVDDAVAEEAPEKDGLRPTAVRPADAKAEDATSSTSVPSRPVRRNGLEVALGSPVTTNENARPFTLATT